MSCREVVSIHSVSVRQNPNPLVPVFHQAFDNLGGRIDWYMIQRRSIGAGKEDTMIIGPDP